jgi:hypothetical protein
MPEVPTSLGGLLGADFTIESGRYKIARIYDTESWNPDLRAPLAAPGVDVSPGDFVLAINGIELKAPDNIHRLLDGTANRQTVLAINSRPSMDGARQVTVVPVANEQTLRTRAWVESNRRLVDKLSNGQLAYVYLPNTGSRATRRSTAITSRSRTRRARHRRALQRRRLGGRLHDRGSARDFDGYFNNVAGDRVPFTSPEAGIWGPKVMIANEMSGSGGDYCRYMFHSARIGTLVGKRTWGGLVHTPTRRVRRRRLDDRAARRLLRRRRPLGRRERGRHARRRRRELAEGRDRGHDPQLEKAVEVAHAAAQGAPGHTHDEGTVASDDRSAEDRPGGEIGSVALTEPHEPPPGATSWLRREARVVRPPRPPTRSSRARRPPVHRIAGLHP